ncbi:hypothetical protein SVI_1296 [Shewanella violacea DSS12]|uniref:Uncharacterized protein n=1 Tax=Shewanella violacea (strain JCM 10179 / CIP 106290 / LMG 19151 / DSS12) TaxID=637905 RepID=D4ZHW8_SHEVD|nr:hypothetical protein SVI_1296 [Shewanella violacea DSS12]
MPDGILKTRDNIESEKALNEEYIEQVDDIESGKH